MANPALEADYFFLGPLIEAHLAQWVPALALPGAVQGVEQFLQATERSVAAPSAFVLFDGDGVATGDAGRASRTSLALTQKWSVLLAVRNADQHQATARHLQAGPLLSLLHRSLHGWTPPGAFRPLQRINGRPPSYKPNVSTYCLTFEAALAL